MRSQSCLHRRAARPPGCGRGRPGSRAAGGAGDALPAGAVRFVGEQPHREVGRWMLASDLFVLCSGYEGLSHVLLEAMAAGLPVLASDVGGNRALVNDGENGLLVPYGDVSATARALGGSWRAGGLAAQLRATARAEAAERTVDGRSTRRSLCSAEAIDEARGRPVRLLLITPKVDPSDDLFGHVNSWASALARRVERLYVVALWPGRPDLPSTRDSPHSERRPTRAAPAGSSDRARWLVRLQRIVARLCLARRDRRRAGPYGAGLRCGGRADRPSRRSPPFSGTPTATSARCCGWPTCWLTASARRRPRASGSRARR